MKQLPVGIQDFITVRDEDYYFVDKSMLIGQILSSCKNGVYLYTRPRRFGKSLNISMLDAFFNIKYKGNTWFDGLEISKHPEFDSYRNAFPVIHLDLKETDSEDMKGYLNNVNNAILKAYRSHIYLQNWDKLTKDEVKLFDDLSMKTITPEDLAVSVSVLSEVLERYHDSKVVILIDEYDGAVNNIKDDNLRRGIVDFIGKLMSHALKGNNSLKLGVVTGIMQIVKENIFSGVNNISRRDIFDIEFDEMFGFTNDEVKQICADYGHPEKFEEAKEWYDGYRFGNADIYNPWSILNYIQRNFKADAYWLNTNENSVVFDLISKADKELTDELKILGSGGSIKKSVEPSLTFKDLSKRKSIYSLMAVSGYLKAVPSDNQYELSIPNRELFSVFSKTIGEIVFDDCDGADKLEDFTNAIMENDIPKMKKTLYNFIAETVSSRVLNDEHSYQAFITGMLMSLCGRYDIKADFENGRGYSDIMMARKKGISPNIIIELKRSENDGCLERDANAALRQIKDRDYAHGLEGKTILYGIAFSGKEPFIISEEI